MLNTKLNRRTKFILFGGILLCSSIFCIFYLPYKLLKKASPYSYAIYDKNGVLLGATVATDGQWHFSTGTVPQKFEKAIIAFEDKRFYKHLGVDFISIGRAFVHNVKNKRVVSGGSTITMQTVRLLEHNPKRTYMQKLHEAILSVFLELRFSKKTILQLYATSAPFGGNVVGLEAAAWRYFNRSPENLTWAEIATLAVLPNQPSLVYPGSNKEILLRKRNALLLKLFTNGEIDETTYTLSLEENLPKKPYPLPSLAPHYLEYLKKQKKKNTKFYTTIDYSIQKNTSRILENWSDKFSKKGINNACAIIIETKTGNVLAYCANTGFFNKEGKNRNPHTWAVDIIQSRRSSGSLLKPFLFNAMLENGMLLTGQLVTDIPTRIGNYHPDNNIPVYRGVVPADEALSRSLNIPAIRELKEYGINAFLNYLKSYGFSTLNRSSDEYGLPLILGGGEITLWDAVHAYALMMNKASEGDVACYQTLEALEKGVRPEDEAMWQLYANSKKIAWKTGTSSGNRDAWAIGTTQEYTIGVWVGNAEGHGTKELTSVATSAPVLFDIFSTLPQTSWPVFPLLDTEDIRVCKNSGYLAGKECKETEHYYKPKASPTSKVCPYCKTVTLTPDKKYQASITDMKNEYAGQLPVLEKYFVLPPSLEYYYTKHEIGYKKLPDFVPWHETPSKDNIEIIFPQQGAHIAIPIELSGERGAMVMEASIRDKSMELFWDLDGVYLGSTKNIHQMSASPNYGKHTLTIMDSVGTQKVRTFTIIETE